MIHGHVRHSNIEPQRWGEVMAPHLSPSTMELPLVSCVIAVRNEATSITGCLDALAAQTYPVPQFEVVVVDGRSVDATRQVVDAWSVARQRAVRLLDNPARSTPAAFNIGVRAAIGNVVVILGARARPHPNFLAASVAALHRTGADAVGGVVETTTQSGGWIARAIGLAQRSPFGVGDARYRYATEGGPVDTVNYGAYRRAVFDRIGGFDESLQWVEDDEFNYRLRAHGGQIVLDPAIRISYFARTSLINLARQRFRWGRGKVRVALRHPAQMQPRHAIPAAFVLSVTATGLLHARGVRAPLRVVVGCYAAAAVLATVRLAARSGWQRALAAVPAAFLSMHLAYGLGTWVGVYDLITGRIPRRAGVPAIGPLPADRIGIVSDETSHDPPTTRSAPNISACRASRS